MAPQPYLPLPQDEKVGGHELENAKKTSRSINPRSLPLTGILCFVLLGSLAVNAFFLHQIYAVPWKLADRLPSKFGTSSMKC